MDDRKYKVKEIKLKKIETEDFKKMTQGINKKLDVVKGPFKRLFAPFKNQLIFVQDELKDLSQMENIPLLYIYHPPGMVLLPQEILDIKKPYLKGFK